MIPDLRVTLKGPDGVDREITDDVSREEGLTKLTLAVERNLHAFRAGNAAVTLEDGAGFYADLFTGARPADRWSLRIWRDGQAYFSGTVHPVDALRVDAKQRLFEINALDLSKALEDVDSIAVSRQVSLALTATSNAGTNTLTLNSTTALVAGDTLLLATGSGYTRENVEIALVTDATHVTLTQNLANTFAATAVVVLTSPYYRQKTPSFLINALLDAAGATITGRVVRLSGVPTRLPIFSDQNTSGLDQIALPSAMLQKGGKEFVAFTSTAFDQPTPDASWSAVGTYRKWIDWTPYRTAAQGEPATFAESPSGDPDGYGVDFTPGALVAYFLDTNGAALCRLSKYTSPDGVTWTGPTVVATVFSAGVGNTIVGFSGDYDSTRNRFYYVVRGSAGTQEFGYYDIGGATDNTIDTSSAYASGATVRYSADLDQVLLFNLGTRRLEAWRLAAKLIESESLGFAFAGDVKQARALRGTVYVVGYNFGVPTVFLWDQTGAPVRTIPLSDPVTLPTFARETLVNGQVRIALTVLPATGAQAVRFFVGDSIFAGVIPYADFSGQGLANSLDDLAVLLNAVFHVDADGVAYFVLRDLDSGRDLFTLDPDDVIERSEEPVWLETYDYVEFRLPTGVASAGTKTSQSRNLSVDCQSVASLGVGTAAAQNLLDFFSKRRRLLHLTVVDDGSPWQLMDPVRYDGVDWIIYAVERDLVNFTLDVQLVEKT